MFELLMELKGKTAVLLDMALCNIVDSFHRIGATCFLHLRCLNFRTTTRLHGVTFSKKTWICLVTAARTQNLSILPLHSNLCSVFRLVVKAELSHICVRETHCRHLNSFLS